MGFPYFFFIVGAKYKNAEVVVREWGGPCGELSLGTYGCNPDDLGRQKRKDLSFIEGFVRFIR